MNAKNSSGLVIVTVLWVVILLGVIVAALGRANMLDSKVSLANQQGLKLRWTCRAATNTAVAVLKEDAKASDSLQDLWAVNEKDFENIELDEFSFNVRVVDEAGKLNINTATKKQLLTLPQMTEEIADCIIDWRDKDDNPKQAGAESGYYQSLQYGYSIRNGQFRTIRELLLVKGVEAELLYGEDSRWIDELTCYSADKNKDSNGEKRININKADENKLAESLKIKKSYAKWIVDNRPKDKGYKSIADLINDKSPKKAKKSKKNSNEAEQLDMETFYKLADKITITDDKMIEGRVNVNTASRIVLEALLEGGEEAEKLADSIITHRKSMLTGMESIAEIMRVNSMNTKTFKKIAEQITTRSDIYSIHSQAANVTSKLKTEAVIDRSISSGALLYYYQGVSN